jgi:hypothetical protein
MIVGSLTIRVSMPEQSLSILSTPLVGLSTIIWNPLWPLVCPDKVIVSLPNFAQESVSAP